MIDQGKRGEPSSPAPGKAPQLLGVMEVLAVPGELGTYRFSLPSATEGEFTFLLECGAKELHFVEYCRFVRHPGGNHPYTFSSMEFNKNPPGIRLGPWPGWRGIPDLPVVTASYGAVSIRLQPAFWGDEITCGVLRLFGRFFRQHDGIVTIAVSGPLIRPRRAFLYHTESLNAPPQPVSLLPERAGVHPRLLITPEMLPDLRERKGGSHSAPWQKLVSVWNNRRLPFETSAESKCVAGPERLSGEDRVLISGLIALLTEGEEDIQQALQAYRDYVLQTQHPDFEPLGIDTQAGEVLFILSVGYDWLFPWLPEPDRGAAWRQIEYVAGICDSYLKPDRTDYGQAHYLGCGLGLVAYSFLLPDEVPDAPNRIAELRGALDCAIALLSKDGSYPHGINLWIYEFGFLLRWFELFRGCSGEDLWMSNGATFGRASAFRAATLSSDARQGITFGDPQYRVGGDSWCHFLIASRTGSGLAQWLGERLVDLPPEGVDYRNAPARRRVYEFLFCDPAVTATPPVGGVQDFLEIGQVTVRSARTLFTMRSGPPLGRARYVAGEYGAYGHSEPASGSFLLERDGQLIASGPGPVYRRDTALHNVVTVDGQGQVGDSTVWLPDFIPPEVLPPILDIAATDSCAAMVADLSKAYLPHLGIEKYTRSVYVDPERAVLGVDYLTLRAVRSVEWNVHSRFPFQERSANGTRIFKIGPEVRLVLLSPAGVGWDTGLMEFVPAYPNDGTRDYQCVVRVRSSEARFIWCYLLASRALPEFRTEKNGAFLVVFRDGLMLKFDGRRSFSRGNA